ncbi:transposase [Nitrosococcus wardiae]|uniref:Peptide synthetase n=1 Tax=Nitrosococcus wardiae TaxID=1814290 RepID=A0A4P7C3R1_9GAMM|nr:transposase [Nitrosococcus wardiae]QBQ56234.1 peptide synthetase [Nitrosococcus wardiae]
MYGHAAGMLLPHLGWRDLGPKCTVSALLHLLFYAAAQVRSLAAACSRLRSAPSDQATRNALVKLCGEVEQVERQLNASFAAQLPKAVLKKGRCRLAVDLNLGPYHGQPYRNRQEIYRSQAKRGTSHFHAYATYYLANNSRRYTVALTRVAQGTSMKEVLKRLLRRAAEAGVKPRLVLLDRGFYSVEVIYYLQAARLAFLMPVICRGRKASDPRGPSGTRLFAVQKRSGWARYTLTHAAQRKIRISICIHCRNGQGRRRRRGRQTLLYAFWGIRPKTTPWVYQTYRLRFGIETSYRQVNEACIKTTTRHPALHLLFVGIAL